MSDSNKSIVLLVGCPGSGKTRAGEASVEFFGSDVVDHLSMGEAIREHKKSARLSSRGRPVRANVIDIFKDFIGNSKTQVSLIDGFPRLHEQTRFYRNFSRQHDIASLALCHVEVPDEVAIERMEQRGMRHPKELSPDKRLRLFR